MRRSHIMKRISLILAVVSLTLTQSIAETKIYRKDGKYYCLVPVDIIDLPSDPDSPNPDPDPDPNPNSDPWNLTKTSLEEFNKIESYGKKLDHAETLAGYYLGIAQSVRLDLVTNEKDSNGVSQLAKVIEGANKLALGTDIDKWQGWIDKTRQVQNSANINSKEQAAQSIEHIAKGYPKPDLSYRLG